jgi:hypothetical protein
MKSKFFPTRPVSAFELCLLEAKKSISLYDQLRAEIGQQSPNLGKMLRAEMRSSLPCSVRSLAIVRPVTSLELLDETCDELVAIVSSALLDEAVSAALFRKPKLVISCV